MKRKINILVIVISVFFCFTGCMGVSHLAHSTEGQAMNTMESNDTNQANQNSQGSVQNTSKVYTCPMHPEVLSDMPGKCPKCGMELVVQNSVANSHEPMKMGCMSMMQSNNHKSHIGMYLGGGIIMVGMMTLMVLRFL
ncbi:MAG TPA: heavy metal-binding domain-containing protein [Bacteroidales bacterium]